MVSNDEHKARSHKRQTQQKHNSVRASHVQKKEMNTEQSVWSVTNISLTVIVALLMVFTQIEIGMASGKLSGATVAHSAVRTNVAGGIDIDSITSTAQTVASVFPVDQIQTAQDAIDMIIPTGTPEYSEAFGGISFDDPVGSLGKLSQMYRPLKAKIETENPTTFQRFMNLASKPVGISCEYCCGLKAVGINSRGDSACGCQHNPALLSVALGLMSSTDYSDAEILVEVMKWKALFFPQNMVDLAIKAADGDIPAGALPKMVGGC